MAALHATEFPATSWQECSNTVNNNFAQAMLPYSQQMMPSLVAEIPLFVFA